MVDPSGRSWWNPASWSTSTWTNIGIGVVVAGVTIATGGAFLGAGLGLTLGLLGATSSVDAIAAGGVIGGGALAGLGGGIITAANA
jgi:hypothetical protein